MSWDASDKKKPPAQLDMNEVKRAAARLRQQRGWDPNTFATEDPKERLRQLNQEHANEAIYQKVCPDCAALREESGDETALCQEHLAEAMGF